MVCYPDGRLAVIDKAGNEQTPKSYDDSLGVYAFFGGLFFIRKCMDDNSIYCGAVDIDGKIHIDFNWHSLSLYNPWDDFKCYAAMKNGQYFLLDKQGKVFEDKGKVFDEGYEFHQEGLNYWWSISRYGNPGKIIANGGILIEDGSDTGLFYPSS
jgi:hypothetical protein